MNAEFNWWLLVVGFVAGAGLAWLVLAEMGRHDRDVDEAELPAEAAWIARSMVDQGVAMTPETAEAVLRAHRAYLGVPPPDALVDPGELRPVGHVEGDPGTRPDASPPDASPSDASPSDASPSGPSPARPG